MLRQSKVVAVQPEQFFGKELSKDFANSVMLAKRHCSISIGRAENAGSLYASIATKHERLSFPPVTEKKMATTKKRYLSLFSLMLYFYTCNYFCRERILLGGFFASAVWNTIRIS